jgi:hypothetical protein
MDMLASAQSVPFLSGDSARYEYSRVACTISPEREK